MTYKQIKSNVFKYQLFTTPKPMRVCALFEPVLRGLAAHLCNDALVEQTVPGKIIGVPPVV